MSAVSFGEFFEAAWKRQPFPWQLRMAELALEGNWPSGMGLPTAAGKTAVIDIAVYAAAVGAPKAGRRVFFVVDRRVIVDEAAERASELAAKLADAKPGHPLWPIAEGLRRLGGAPDPLISAVLRGGIARDDLWADSPLQPTVICSTVDQVGSSLLFRAYGASAFARPIRAALTGCDSVIFLDEAHTSQPFAETLGWVKQYREWAEQPLALPFTVVEMSATPRAGAVFEESGDDLADPVLNRRWSADKRARLVLVDSKAGDPATELVAGFCEQARRLRDECGAKVIGVVVKSRADGAARSRDAERG